MYGTRSHFSKILLLTKTCKPSCGRSETSSGREVVVGGNMEMQLFPVPFPNGDALLLIHKVVRPTPNLPQTALIPVPAQRNLLRHTQKYSGIDSIPTKKESFGEGMIRIESNRRFFLTKRKDKKKGSTFPLSHMRSEAKDGETATVVVVERWSGWRVTLMLSLMGRMRTSSRLPQYLITAMLVGDLAVTINTQSFDSSPIFLLQHQRYKQRQRQERIKQIRRKQICDPRTMKTTMAAMEEEAESK